MVIWATYLVHLEGRKKRKDAIAKLWHTDQIWLMFTTICKFILYPLLHSWRFPSTILVHFHPFSTNWGPKANKYHKWKEWWRKQVAVFDSDPLFLLSFSFPSLILFSLLPSSADLSLITFQFLSHPLFLCLSISVHTLHLKFSSSHFQG